MKRITSAANPAVKGLVDLRKGKVRRARGLMLVEGLAEVRRLLAAGIEVTQIYFVGELPPDLEQLDQEPVELAGAAASRAFVRERGAGVLVVARRPSFALDALALRQPSAVVIAERIEKPGNLGAMLRTADAAGADAVIACDSVTDLAGPNVIRASLGSIFAIPVASAGVPDATTWCRARDVQIVALDPGADTLLYELDLTRPTALAIGAEHEGLSSALTERADVLARLPMAGSADSLNASTALAVGLFELVRQRLTAS